MLMAALPSLGEVGDLLHHSAEANSAEANVTELVWIYPEVAIGREDFATAAHRCGVELGGDTRRIDDWFDRLHKSFSLPLLPREAGCLDFFCAC